MSKRSTSEGNKPQRVAYRRSFVLTICAIAFGGLFWFSVPSAAALSHGPVALSDGSNAPVTALKAGDTVYCNAGVWVPSEPGYTLEFSFEWFLDGTQVPPPPGVPPPGFNRYVIQEADAGKVIWCAVTAREFRPPPGREFVQAARAESNQIQIYDPTSPPPPPTSSAACRLNPALCSSNTLILIPSKPLPPSPPPPCMPVVKFAHVIARSSCWRERNPGIYIVDAQDKEDAQARINGIDITASGPDAKIYLEDPTRPGGGGGGLGVRGQVKVSAGRLPEGIPIDNSAISSDFVPEGSRSSASAWRVLPELKSVPGSKFRGFPIVGTIGVRLVNETAQFTVNVKLPAPFGGATGVGTFETSDNPAGLFVPSFAISIPQAPLCTVSRIEALRLMYDPAANTWTKSTGGPKTLLNLFGLVNIGLQDRTDVEFQNGELTRAGWEFGVNSSIPIPISAGIDLNAVSLSLVSRTNVCEVSLEVGVSAGPVLREIRAFDFITDQAPALGRLRLIEGHGKVTVDVGLPPKIHIQGLGKVIGSDVGELGLTLDWTLPASSFGFSISATVSLDGESFLTGPFGIAGAFAKVSGFVERSPLAFNAEGQGDIYLLSSPRNPPGLGWKVGGAVLFSSRGIAACAGPYGFGYSPGANPPIELFSNMCDVGKWRVTASGARVSATSQNVAIPKGLPTVAFAVIGKTSAPLLTVTGPRGEKASTAPAAGRIAPGQDPLVFQSQTEKTTYIIVKKPAGGRWQISLQDGSSPLVEIRRAYGLPKASVKARVVGHGRKRILRYRLKRIPGQRVVFTEGAAGLGRTIGRATGSRGAIRFTPAVGRRGRRSILARVEQGGHPRGTIVAASYKAPPPARPGKPRRVSTRRRGSSLIVRWRKARAAKRYVVRVAISDGRRLFFSSKRRAIKVADLLRTESARVSVAGVGANYLAGRAAKAKVKGAKQKKGKRGKRRQGRRR